VAVVDVTQHVRGAIAEKCAASGALGQMNDYDEEAS